jgi:hypothetical protein
MDAVKELISAGCDINLAMEVKQMTRLALALALGSPLRDVWQTCLIEP